MHPGRRPRGSSAVCGRIGDTPVGCTGSGRNFQRQETRYAAGHLDGLIIDGLIIDDVVRRTRDEVDAQIRGIGFEVSPGRPAG